jgi:hypothetical protein
MDIRLLDVLLGICVRADRPAAALFVCCFVTLLPAVAVQREDLVQPASTQAAPQEW